MKHIEDRNGETVTLHDLCKLIYQGFGQSGVEKFAHAFYEDLPSTVQWDECEPCENEEPFYKDVCLVCGSKKED